MWDLDHFLLALVLLSSFTAAAASLYLIAYLKGKEAAGRNHDDSE